ncbi:hypothetical protein ACMYM1_23440, partial [Salmonella enterica subsp. enterica serovar Enteritidis]|uniref:hypothetical protein n=1 Tax=Salmonella enterica TaxID=28901 RepID=UPI0039EA4EC3
LADYPDGKLICCRQGHLFKWYLKTDGRKTYIPKARKNLAEQLAAKKYLTCLLADLNQEKAAAESYLNLSRKAPSAAALLTKDGRY